MRLSFRALAAGLGFLVAVSMAAQTTGSVVGRATDESGGSLPGVTVEAKSSALQGSRVAATDSGGRYRLTLLPPGAYTVSFTLAGFAVESRTGIVVSLAKDTTLDVALRPEAKEAIVVTAEAPVVDTTSSTTGSNFDTREITTLPTGRNYTSVVL